jgi:hypothetical protein
MLDFDAVRDISERLIETLPIRTPLDDQDDYEDIWTIAMDLKRLCDDEEILRERAARLIGAPFAP